MDNISKGDKLWYFDGASCPQEVIFDKYIGEVASFCKVVFPDGESRATIIQYLFDDFEELIIAVEGHAWVLNKWAKENKDI